MATYVAKKKGFFDGSLLQPGEEFEADDFSGAWAVPVDQYVPEAPEDPAVLAEKAREGLQGKKTKKKKVSKKKTKKKVSKKKA